MKLMMFSSIFSVESMHKKGVVIGSVLFVLQMIYFQFQIGIEGILIDLSGLSNHMQVLGITITYASSIVGFFHILVHASFSIVIVWLIYRDRFNTKFVIGFSIFIIAFYLLIHMIGHSTQLYVFQMMATKVRYFISSPLKTIFSIPMLKIREAENQA